MKQFSKFVGLDTHKDTIAVAVSEGDGGPTRWYYGEIPNTPKALAPLAKKSHSVGTLLLAGRTGAADRQVCDLLQREEIP